MSGFVYKVRVGGQTLIKKEIPGPDTVDEFLYEVNALSALKFSSSIIGFFGVVVDDANENVKGLLIDYAEQGSLIDLIYDSQEHGPDLPWATRERWARQIVQGLADVHEAGFVQGDFTLSNIVIDEDENAKIIDINRRGCPVGWEPPEATPLIDSNQRISMYIGVKSDLYQLGMVLWALATLEDEPEAHHRPLRLDPEIEVPTYYRRVVENCLCENPRVRLQATALLAMFPEARQAGDLTAEAPPIIVEDDCFVQEYRVKNLDGRPQMTRTVTRCNDWPSLDMGGHSSAPSPGLSEDSYYYPPRGRSPPSPLPSPHGHGAPYAVRKMMWLESTYTGGPPSRSVSRDDSQTRAESRRDVPGVGTGKLESNFPSTDGSPGHLLASTTAGDVAERHGGFNNGGAGFLESNEPTPIVEMPGPGDAGTMMRSKTGPGGVCKDGAQGSKWEATPPEGSDAEIDLAPSYTYSATGATYERHGEAAGPGPGGPETTLPTGLGRQHGDLVGIGSAYNTKNQVRQPAYSNEDVGRTKATASLPSQA